MAVAPLSPTAANTYLAKEMSFFLGPDGGRPDLFWDTVKPSTFLATRESPLLQSDNPHSGCCFLSRRQALAVRHYWVQQNWRPEWSLSGPLEQAGSGMLLPVLRLMKPIPEHYRFLMVRHQDNLWKRHSFEAPEASGSTSS